MYVVHEVGGPERLEFLWAPRSPPAPAGAEPTAHKRDIEYPRIGMVIGPVFPNPFN